jgi:hypothetical protein
MNQEDSQSNDGDSNNPQATDNTSRAPSQSSNVTLKSIRRKLEDFQVIGTKNLGEGSYGQVKAVKEKATGHRYAMKIIAKSNLLSFASINNIKREIKIQSKLKHPHIIRLIYYFENPESVYMIMEYAENGEF